MKHRSKRLLLFLISFSLLLFGMAGLCWGSSLEKGPVNKIEAGINYYTLKLVNWEGKAATGYVVEVNPAEALVEIRLAMGEDRLGGMETVSSTAGRYGAAAAINGGFFDPGTGNPIGSLVLDKELIFKSDILRTSVGLTGQGKLQAGYFNPGAAQGWEGLSHLVTGGPLLVADGVPVFNAVAEGFKGSVLLPAPRTAIGETVAGKVLLVVVDGSKGAGYGLTLDEMAWLMAALGAEKAAALDGGGSSAMWVNKGIVNRPSDGSERKVANAILVLRQLPVYLDETRLFFDVPPLVESGRTLVPLRKIFEALGAKVDWDPETETVTAARGDREIRLAIGSKTAFVNGGPVSLDVPGQVRDGRSLVPLRFVGESLRAAVHWQDAPAAIFIKSSDKGVS